jgi:spermidine synthase
MLPDKLCPVLQPANCRYYSQEVHKAAFVLPAFAKDALAGSLTY